MKRFKIVHAKPISSFGSDWLRPIFDQYLEFEPWDPSRTYDPGTGFYLNCLDFPDYNNVLPAAPEELVDRGFCVIVDTLWEAILQPLPAAHQVRCNAWFWYNESLWYQHLGYNQYRPQRSPNYRALMPMNLVRPHRTDFLNSIKHLLDNMMWSYVGTGRQLPNDGDMTDWNTQRHFNNEWYDQTYCSMVVETAVRPFSKYTPIFITEKTMKPLAFQHPFMVYGNRGILRTLKSWGFETFDNLWDENYDEIIDQEQRRDAVIEILSKITIKDHDLETLRRLQHNQNHFYNRKLVIDKILKEIVEPILHYAETR